MNIVQILKAIAALATVATGLLSFFKPTAVQGFTGLNAAGSRGISEIRSIFGGLFIALGIAPFFLGEQSYLMLGFSYLGIAVARAFSIAFDKSYEQTNIISLVIEIILGIILVL
jgi:hypothetical protein